VSTRQVNAGNFQLVNLQEKLTNALAFDVWIPTMMCPVTLHAKMFFQNNRFNHRVDRVLSFFSTRPPPSHAGECVSPPLLHPRG
jgi:hypothetical protein